MTQSSVDIPKNLALSENSTINLSETASSRINKKVHTLKDKVSRPDINKSNIKDVPLPYKEPDWSGPPPPSYGFEVVKNGTIISNITIQKSFFTIGRLEICDIMLEHPSVSRFHAVVQYCAGDETHQKGFYLYDLGSTHGTFLNKEQIKPKIYYKIKVGHVLKFGGSTRLHIFEGPIETDDGDKNVSKSEPAKKAEEMSCSWGLSEDAEEEDDLSENPFALSTANEELYLDDPKKTLRGWFEREGYELEYIVEEKGFRTFLCQVQLPIDSLTGEFVPVEASVSGKKKEAVVACALEACRTLDRYGLLRQSQHESRQRKKKNWEDEDFYDSDEDTYLDRTGVIEKKREIRKNLEKKSAETFESLSSKLKFVNENINEIETKLQASLINHVPKSDDKEADSLDSYMQAIANPEKSSIDKVMKSKLKLQLAELEIEKKKLEKLLNIAKPTKLPPISKFPGIIGKRSKTKLQLPVSKPINTKPKENEPEIEEDDDNNEENISECETSIEKVESLTELETCSEAAEPQKFLTDDNKDEISSELKFKVLNVKHAPKRNNIQPIMFKTEEKQTHSEKRRKKVVYDDRKADYSTWVPPVNQSGDGKTHLNDKYGY